MAISIIVRFQKSKQKECELPQSCRIGRFGHCDVVIDDPRVSSEHLEIIVLPSGALKFADLNSSNGTYLNGYLVREDFFMINDRLQIGDTIIFIKNDGLTEFEKKIIGVRALEVLEKKSKIKKLWKPQKNR